MKRKQFIIQLALVAAGLKASSFMKSKKEIGIQLWSLKMAMQKNVDEALKRVAEAGYSFVEPAGHDLNAGTFHGLKPKELRRKVNGLGMKMYSCHCQISGNNAAKICEQAAEAGLKYVIRPSLSSLERESIDAYKKVADEFNNIGEVAKKYGLQFGFHNHAQEFEEKNGQLPYDILLSGTDKNNVVFQMDIGWVVFAKQSPVTFFKKYPGRFPLWHIRDLDALTRDSIAIGKGDLDFSSIFKEKKLAGLKYGIVEISSKDETNVFENIQSSNDFLNEASFY